MCVYVVMKRCSNKFVRLICVECWKRENRRKSFKKSPVFFQDRYRIGACLKEGNFGLKMQNLKQEFVGQVLTFSIRAAEKSRTGQCEIVCYYIDARMA